MTSTGIKQYKQKHLVDLISLNIKEKNSHKNTIKE